MPIGHRNSAIPGGGIHHIAVQALDWAESLKFYQEVLGMAFIGQLETLERKIVLLDAGDGAHIELFEPTADTVTRETTHFPVLHFALTTTDIEAAVARVRAAGYEITVEPKTLTFAHMNITIAFCVGPSREVVEFFQVNN